MSHVKIEAVFNLLKYFRWLAQSHNITRLNFHVEQKQHAKDSGWSVSQAAICYINKHLMKKTLVWLLATDRCLESVSFRNCCVGKALLKTTSELSSFVALNISPPGQSVTPIHWSATEFITSCLHSYVFKLPWVICTDFLSAFTYYVCFLSIKRIKLN